MTHHADLLALAHDLAAREQRVRRHRHGGSLDQLGPQVPLATRRIGDDPPDRARNLRQDELGEIRPRRFAAALFQYGRVGGLLLPEVAAATCRQGEEEPEYERSSGGHP